MSLLNDRSSKIFNQLVHLSLNVLLLSIFILTTIFNFDLLQANTVTKSDTAKTTTLKTTLSKTSPMYIKSVYSLPLTLDPIQMNDTASLLVGNLIYDGLLKYSPTLSIEPNLAESWSTSVDGKTITFILRKNLKFHDGSEVTSSDVVFSLLRLLSSESKVRKYYDCILESEKVLKLKTNQLSLIEKTNIIKGIKSIDNYTIQIILKNPYPAFLSVLAGATAKILPKKNFKDLISTKDKKFFDHPIGSGAFKYISRDTDKKEIILNAFYENRIKIVGHKNKSINVIDQLMLKETIEDEALKLASNGQVDDLANWPLQVTNQIFSKSSSGQKISSPVLATWIIGINTKLHPFSNLQVRQMFKHSIDSEKFRLKFYPDAIPATGYVPYGLPASQLDLNSNSSSNSNLNLNEIKNILQEKISIAIPEELSSSKEIKSFFETDLKEKGWNVEVQLMPWNKLMEGYVNKTLQSFLVSMNMDYPNAEFLLKNFESNSPDNFSGLNNIALDQTIKAFSTKQDKREREILYKQALQKIEELAVTVNLFYPKAHYWISNCVENFEPSLLSDVYIDYSKILIKENCKTKNISSEK